ncbi:RHH-type proline utilization regulon transcriptional repressor/proline dehydrogenase/delta 1-pyrroline-5-carboxylate dehydrogenase [Leucobacter luti]|uniref:aldehyde dehydrogenase family protein n=1 Tax=Leucobacter luti TaxID=340320 RepID=UPI0010D0CA51|nr:aldehyde dehydrogenase family protein [Leucobacter luti]MCW2289451.1 RHH-type proline utilization regulon transcriptional repressor/proline dehydrogenase/delta 1-pyrroline-5-carboxylate dehydrogenase [Leucobacter luti]TCK40010.1 RHH-type proline utilization regulon transcriptional repressor/proline dehydrogenase/delta 1-pyrroline-5-carboxylate dehydrogenase [Leucobacter luti]
MTRDTSSSVQGPVWPRVVDATQSRATAWIDAIGARGDTAARAPLGGMHRDPESFDFTRRLLELLGSTEDAFASAVGLRDIAQEVPASMSARDRLAMRAGGAASLGLPWAIMPVARRWLRSRLSSLVLATQLPKPGSAADADGTLEPGRLTALAEELRRLRDAGTVPVVAPLGAAVHGPEQAAAEVHRLAALAAHAAVTHLVVDPARIAPGGNDWSADTDTIVAAAALQPILAAAAEHGTTIHLEPRSVRWARRVPAVLARALTDPALDRARVATRVFAELPESRELYDQLSRWAQRRVAEGGAPAEVVIGVAGVAGAERIASIQSGLAVPVLEDPHAVAAQLLRLTELALHPGRAAVLRPVIASEDPLLLAAAIELAEQRGITELVSVQLRVGVVPGLAEVIAEGGTQVRTVLPVVSPGEFAGAVDLLVGLAAEAADPISPASRVEALLRAGGSASGADADADADGDAPSAPSAIDRAAALAADAATFGAAAELAAEPAPTSHRTQLRAREWDPSERDSALFYRAPDEPARFETGGLTAAVLGLSRGATGAFQLEEFAPVRAIPAVSNSGFANEPGTDASIPANRDWMREQLQRAADRVAAQDPVHDTIALSAADLDPARAALTAHESAERWSMHGPAARAVRLRRAALAVVAARDRLVQALAADTGAPAAELDAEINDIVDAARYSGQLSEGLGAVRGASFLPGRVVLVTGDRGTSLARYAEAVFSALGAGSAVLLAVPQRLLASTTALIEECEAGGLTPGAVLVEAVAAHATVAELAAHEQIDRALVLGGREIGRELARRRPDLRIEGQFRARGSILVAPSADRESAIDDIVASGFRAAGADVSAAHEVILLGSVARSRGFREDLADAVRALRVGDTARPGNEDPLSFDLGPLPGPPDAAGLRALTELGRGEEWLVEPRQLDDAGTLWSPGVRLGVAPDAGFWRDALEVPVIGITTAHSLAEGIDRQNAPGAGSVAALYSNDGDEIAAWLEHVRAAAVSINRATTGARIERHPSGGWDDAVMGLPALSGGPNRLLALGSWQPRQGTRSDTLHLRGLDPEVRLLIAAAQPSLAYEEFDAVRRAALADALVWRTSFAATRDAIGLGIERNTLRYRSVVTQVRLAEDGPAAGLIRVLAAALLVRAPIAVSTGQLLAPEVAEVLEGQGIEVSLERDEDWMERIAVTGPLGPGEAPASRVRLIGGDAIRVAEWMGGLDRAALWAEPVTMAGPVELLTLLQEQSVSARAHRHGLAIPVPGWDEALGGA